VGDGAEAGGGSAMSSSNFLAAASSALASSGTNPPGPLCDAGSPHAESNTLNDSVANIPQGLRANFEVCRNLKAIWVTSKEKGCSAMQNSLNLIS
jgi:hypothetical protein